MISQLGVLLKSDSPHNPLRDYQVRAVMGCGATGGDLSAYAAAVHPISRNSAGEYIYDGFLIFMTGAPGSLNQAEDKLSPVDNRCKIYSPVPLMRVYTTDDMLGTGHHPDWAAMQRRPDSDFPGEQYRSYELSGTGRVSLDQSKFSPSKEDVERAGRAMRNPRSAFTPSGERLAGYPLKYALNAAYDNLKKWICDGIEPPHGQPLEISGNYPDIELVLDQFGIPKGGIRTPFTDVPVAHMTPGTVDIPSTYFDKETLASLYGTGEGYLQKFIRSTLTAVMDRWILPEDAVEILMDAIKSCVPENGLQLPTVK